MEVEQRYKSAVDDIGDVDETDWSVCDVDNSYEVGVDAILCDAHEADVDNAEDAKDTVRDVGGVDDACDADEDDKGCKRRCVDGVKNWIWQQFFGKILRMSYRKERYCEQTGRQVGAKWGQDGQAGDKV